MYALDLMARASLQLRTLLEDVQHEHHQGRNEATIFRTLDQAWPKLSTQVEILASVAHEPRCLAKSYSHVCLIGHHTVARQAGMQGSHSLEVAREYRRQEHR